MPNYLLQWNMIQWALEKKCRIYDFRGVSGDLSEDNPLYGLYKFKKGFNGEFTEFVGEMDLISQQAPVVMIDKATKLYQHRNVLKYRRENRDKAPEAPKERLTRQSDFTGKKGNGDMEPKYIVCREDLEHNIRILKEKAKGKLIWGCGKRKRLWTGDWSPGADFDDCGIDHFAVTSLAEAQAVRDAGMTHHPILMLRGSTDPEEVEGLLKLGVTLSLGSRADTELLEEIAAQLDVVAKVHVEMDTGMGRYGFTSDERIWVDAIYHEVYPHIRPIGLYTHFHTAGKRWQVLQQVNRFQWTLERLRLPWG